MGNLQEYIQRVKPTWMNLTPTVARMLSPEILKSSVSKILLAGEMVKESDAIPWLDAGIEVYNVYGPAESVLICTVGRICRGKASDVGTGKNIYTWVADMEKRRLVPLGAIGELIVEGPQVAPGYLNDPVRTKKQLPHKLGIHSHDSEHVINTATFLSNR